MNITIDSRIRIPLVDLSDYQAESLRAQFTHANPAYRKGKSKDEPPTYRTWEHDEDGNIALPLGGESRVATALFSFPCISRYYDGRTWDHPRPNFPEHQKQARDYQEELIEAAIRSDRGILRAPTGVGKTTAAFGLLARLKRRSLVVVWSSALLKQWRDRAEEELGMETGIIGGGHMRIRDLTLAMDKTLWRRFKDGDRSLVDEFDVVLADEVQRFAAPTLFGAIDPFKAKKRIGISADETRNDEKEFLIYDLFGPVLADIDEKRVIASGSIVEVEIDLVPTAFDARWYKYRRDFNLLLEQMTNDDKRNALILSLVRSAVSSGEQVILFTHRVEHARLLDRGIASMGIPGGLMLGGIEEAEEFDRTKARLREGVARAAVGTYEAIGAGIDLPSVARGIATTPMHNNRQKIGQVKGRICRASDGKKFGKLAYLYDYQVYGNKPVTNFVSWFREVRVWWRGAWISGEAYIAESRARSLVANG